MGTIDRLNHNSERQRQAANDACKAAHTLARTANRSAARVIPAPVAYDLLGNIKMLLHYLQEVTENLPDGLTNSLNDDRIAVYDRDANGTDRDPLTQINQAGRHLHALTKSVALAATQAEAAQRALNGQGYNEATHQLSRARGDRQATTAAQKASFPRAAASGPTTSGTRRSTDTLLRNAATDSRPTGLAL